MGCSSNGYNIDVAIGVEVSGCQIFYRYRTRIKNSSLPL
jgi:hypothetical protein